MQRSQRGRDNHALDLAINEANARKLPVVVFLAPIPFYPHANLRHYRFLQQGIADTARDVEARNCTFVLRRYPDHSLEKLIAEVRPALLIGDENPMREPEHWREVVAERVKLPFWNGRLGDRPQRQRLEGSHGRHVGSAATPQRIHDAQVEELQRRPQPSRD